jgi:hypothetical protein
MIGSIAVPHPVDSEAVAFQSGTDRLRDHGIVFYQQKSHDPPYPIDMNDVSRNRS